MTPVAPRRWPKQLFRLVTLVVPSWLAWYVAFAEAHPDELTIAVKYALGPLWLLLMAALALRTIAIVASPRREPPIPILSQLDVLTSSGSALAWLSAGAIMGAVWLGWASLAVVGLLGTGLFHVVVLYTMVAVRSFDPMHSASITRRFVPDVATEGDEVIEELRFSGTRIPPGFRLFATGRVGARWATSRYVLEGAEAGGEVVLESKIGPAVRGEHDAEPLAVWLQDTFGLCRSIRVDVGASHLTVLPRLREAQHTTPLLGRGEGPRAPRATVRLPTEGSFRLREYQQGDDVRRIHWVRSLAARQLIVRLPDELPPDRPHVRLVLDTFFAEAEVLECDTPSELLDSVVSTWLAVARSLAESGVRVTLVAAVPNGDAVAIARHDFSLRTTAPALRLGAQVEWQGRMMVDELLTDEATLVVSRAVLARPHPYDKARWIVVLPSAISPEPPWRAPSNARWHYPMGTLENRWSQRRREENRVAIARRDRARTVAMRADMVRPPPGSFLACPEATGAIRVEVIR